MRILIIEDNIETVRGICDNAEDAGWEQEVCDFDESSKIILDFNPDIIVMDWMYDVENIDRGEPIFKEIYENGFRPTIIFSAVADTIDLPDYMKNTPLIEIIKKGDEQIVINRINEWEPYISAVKNLRSEMNNALLTSIQVVDNFMKMEKYPGDDVLKYMLKKRTTFYFDKEYIGNIPPAWIQYEYPPIHDTLLVADIIRIYSDKTNINGVGKPDEYRIILTPSCDMARAKNGFIILVAKCKEANMFSDDAQISGEELKDENIVTAKREKLIHSLNTGYNHSKVALPLLPNKIPYMTIDLRKLEQIRIGDIAKSEKEIKENTKYYRVASVSSPFREQIVWAYMINSCRPGMPDRDMFTWAEGILKK